MTDEEEIEAAGLVNEMDEAIAAVVDKASSLTVVCVLATNTLAEGAKLFAQMVGKENGRILATRMFAKICNIEWVDQTETNDSMH